MNLKKIIVRKGKAMAKTYFDKKSAIEVRGLNILNENKKTLQSYNILHPEHSTL